jgi:hypothetical protein
MLPKMYLQGTLFNGEICRRKPLSWTTCQVCKKAFVCSKENLIPELSGQEIILFDFLFFISIMNNYINIMKEKRLIELLIKKVESTYECDVHSLGLNENERNELLELISFYKEKINIENLFKYPTEWNWTGFDYDRGYKDAESKFSKIIKNKDEEIKKLTKKPIETKSN